MKYKAALDADFYPIICEINRQKGVQNQQLSIMIEDADGYNFDISFVVEKDTESGYKLAERMLKSLIWIVGGCTAYVCGNEAIAKRLADDYSLNGTRAFDAQFMQDVYKREFKVLSVDRLPAKKRRAIAAGGHTEGCRIGFDAGGSDRKVSAVVDGEVIFSEEVVWFPKINSDPTYHYEGILSAFRTAASKMERVDAIGVSSAGIYINNRTCVASLFLKVDKDNYESVRDIYIRAARQIGKDIPLEVANDGDVTAIAGAISLASNNVLGIAMGTSEAGGYVNSEGGLNGWLTELAFVPCDLSEGGAVDEWSGDGGTGVKYFSQDAVIKLAKNAGIELDESLSPAEKLKIVQQLMEKGDERARKIYQSIGVYLGYTIPFYQLFYDVKYVLVLGRVLSGAGGELIVSTAREVLQSEFNDSSVQIVTPDERFKRVGQSIAAASLPKINN